MDLMFRQKYQAVIGIPTDVLAVVRRINESRNKLHFTSEVGGELSGKLVKDLKLLDAFVDLQLTRIGPSL